MIDLILMFLLGWMFGKNEKPQKQEDPTFTENGENIIFNGEEYGYVREGEHISNLA